MIVDTREPVEICWLLEGAGFEFDRVALDSGDYLWVARGGTSVAVERKTVLDLLHSLSDRQANKRPRIINQILRMREAYDEVILLIEGHLVSNSHGKVVAEGRTSTWSWEALDNFLLTVQRAGVAVVRTPKNGLPTRLASLMTYYEKPVHLLPPLPRSSPPPELLEEAA